MSKVSDCCGAEPITVEEKGTRIFLPADVGIATIVRSIFLIRKGDVQIGLGLLQRWTTGIGFLCVEFSSDTSFVHGRHRW